MIIRSHIISNALPEFGLEKALNEGVSDDFPPVGFSIETPTTYSPLLKTEMKSAKTSRLHRLKVV